MLKAVRLQSFLKGKGDVSGRRLRSSETSFFREGPMQLEERLVERDELLQRRADAAGRKLGRERQLLRRRADAAGKKLWSRVTSFFQKGPMHFEES